MCISRLQFVLCPLLFWLCPGPWLWQQGRTSPCCFGYAVLWSSAPPRSLAQSRHKKPFSAAKKQREESHGGISSWELAPGAVSLWAGFPPRPGRLRFWWFHESVSHQLPRNADLERGLLSSCFWEFSSVLPGGWVWSNRGDGGTEVKISIALPEVIFRWFTGSRKSRRWCCVP